MYEFRTFYKTMKQKFSRLTKNLFNFVKGTGLPPEYNALLQPLPDDQHDMPEMKTFSQKQQGPVTPYATTALLQAQNARKMVLILQYIRLLKCIIKKILDFEQTKLYKSYKN